MVKSDQKLGEAWEVANIVPSLGAGPGKWLILYRVWGEGPGKWLILYHVWRREEGAGKWLIIMIHG